MIRFALLPRYTIYLPGCEPKPPKVEGPDLSDGEIVVFLIVAVILTAAAISLTAYFFHAIKKQKIKSNKMMINNQKFESEVHINGKHDILS